jgi:hypothetical protein
VLLLLFSGPIEPPRSSGLSGVPRWGGIAPTRFGTGTELMPPLPLPPAPPAFADGPLGMGDWPEVPPAVPAVALPLG